MKEIDELSNALTETKLKEWTSGPPSSSSCAIPVLNCPFELHSVTVTVQKLGLENSYIQTVMTIFVFFGPWLMANPPIFRSTWIFLSIPTISSFTSFVHCQLSPLSANLWQFSVDTYRETEMIQTALRRPSIPKLRKGGTQLCERDSKQLRASGSKSLCVVKNVVLGGHAQVAQRKACIELYMCICMRSFHVLPVLWDFCVWRWTHEACSMKCSNDSALN